MYFTSYVSQLLSQGVDYPIQIKSMKPKSLTVTSEGQKDSLTALEIKITKSMISIDNVPFIELFQIPRRLTFWYRLVAREDSEHKNKIG